MKVLHRRVCRNEAVVSAELDGEAVLLNVETGIYFGLNDLGTEIWKQLEQSACYEEILTHLQEAYEVEPGQLEVDFVRFIDTLCGHGLACIVDE